jgi:hypothetical protein
MILKQCRKNIPLRPGYAAGPVVLASSIKEINISEDGPPLDQLHNHD